MAWTKLLGLGMTNLAHIYLIITFNEVKLIKTLFINTKEKDILVFQVYVDDILLGTTNDSLWKKFSEIMCKEFEMRMIGDLTFFLGLQIKQKIF